MTTNLENLKEAIWYYDRKLDDYKVVSSIRENRDSLKYVLEIFQTLVEFPSPAGQKYINTIKIIIKEIDNALLIYYNDAHTYECYYICKKLLKFILDFEEEIEKYPND